MVVEFLEGREDVNYINVYPEPGVYGAAGLTAGVNIELIPEIAGIEGVVRVEKVRTMHPLSSQRQPASNPAVLERMCVKGVDNTYHCGGGMLYHLGDA